MSLNSSYINFGDIVFELIQIDKMDLDDERNIYYSELKLVTGLKDDLTFKSGKIKYIISKKKNNHTELFFEFISEDFFIFCQKLDEFIISSLANDSIKKFKTQLNKEKLKDIYKPLINIPFSFNQKPLFKLNVPTVTMDELNLIEGVTYELILNYPRILFYKNKFIIETIIENIIENINEVSINQAKFEEHSDEFQKQLSILDSDFAN